MKKSIPLISNDLQHVLKISNTYVGILERMIQDHNYMDMFNSIDRSISCLRAMWLIHKNVDQRPNDSNKKNKVLHSNLMVPMANYQIRFSLKLILFISKTLNTQIPLYGDIIYSKL